MACLSSGRFGLLLFFNKLMKHLVIDQGPVPERRNNSIPGLNVSYFKDNFIPGLNSVPGRRNSTIWGINLG